MNYARGPLVHTRMCKYLIRVQLVLYRNVEIYRETALIARSNTLKVQIYRSSLVRVCVRKVFGLAYVCIAVISQARDRSVAGSG